MEVLFVKFLVLGVGLLYFFQTVLYLLVHDLLDVVDLALFLDQHVIGIFSFWIWLHQLLLFLTQLEIQHLNFLYECYPVLACLVLQWIKLFNWIVVFLFQNLVLVHNHFPFILSFLLLCCNPHLVLVFDSWHLILKRLNFVSKDINLLNVNSLLFFHFIFNLLYNFILTGLISFPILQYFLLESFFFHFVIIFELDDWKLDVSFLFFKVFSILLVKRHNLSFILLLLLIEFVGKLVNFDFKRFGDFVDIWVEFFVFLENWLILTLNWSYLRFQILDCVLVELNVFVLLF